MGSSQSGWWLARSAARTNFPLVIPTATYPPNGAVHAH